MDGPEETIEDKDIADALRRRARRIHVQAATAGAAYGIVVWLAS